MSKEKEATLVPLFGIQRREGGWVTIRAMFNPDTKRVHNVEDSIEDVRTITEESFKRLVAKHWTDLDNA